MKATEFISEFSKVINWKFEPPKTLSNELEVLLNKLNDQKCLSKQHRVKSIFFHINKKFKLNSVQISDFLGLSAKLGITFNYHQKNKIYDAFDLSDPGKLFQVLKSNHRLIKDKTLRKELESFFKPITKDETLPEERSALSALLMELLVFWGKSSMSPKDLPSLSSFLLLPIQFSI